MFTHFAATGAEGATGVLFQYGLAGVVIFGLTWAVVFLYRDNQRLHREKDELQEARRTDAGDSFQKVVDLGNNFSQTSQLFAAKIEVVKDRRS